MNPILAGLKRCLLAAAMALGAVCSHAAPVTVTDDRGVTVNLPAVRVCAFPMVLRS